VKKDEYMAFPRVVEWCTLYSTMDRTLRDHIERLEHRIRRLLESMMEGQSNRIRGDAGRKGGREWTPNAFANRW